MNIQIFCIRWDGYPVTEKIKEALYDIAQDLFKLKSSYIEFDFGWCKGEVYTEWQILEVDKIIGCVFYSTIYVGGNSTTIEYIAREYVEDKNRLEFLVNQSLIETDFGMICRN